MKTALLVACGALAALLASACSDAPRAGNEPRARPPGPAADVSEELPGGNGGLTSPGRATNV
ncbi:MAG TPA: hypothetical protein VFD92_02690 [Candidatus Binatia bacterium]|nr:hypothetical protein [Candidatus Binatia bacterium]